jgi:hypothetical protein
MLMGLWTITGMMMEAVRTYETSVYFNENTRRYVTEGYLLQPKNQQINTCLKYIRVMMLETVTISETSINLHQTTWRNIPYSHAALFFR